MLNDFLPDMLEERARIMVNYGYPSEIVILLDQAEAQ